MSLSLTGLYTGILGFIMVFLAMRVIGAGPTISSGSELINSRHLAVVFSLTEHFTAKSVQLRGVSGPCFFGPQDW